MTAPKKPERPRSALPEQSARPQKRSVREALDDAAPWKPAPYELKHASAVQAVGAGTATAEQQRLALDWIMYGACALRDEPYRPGGADGERDTAFALGKANVARQIAKLMTVNIGVLRRSEPLGDLHEPKS